MDLFASAADPHPSLEVIAEGAMLLRGFVGSLDAELIDALRDTVRQAPFHHMVTPGGYQMSVAMSNCGSAGWITGRIRGGR